LNNQFEILWILLCGVADSFGVIANYYTEVSFRFTYCRGLFYCNCSKSG